MKDKIYDRLANVLFLVLMGVIIYFTITDRNKVDELKEYWENKEFKTDTVYVAVDYSKLPKPTFEYTVPPAKVYHYPVTNVSYISAALNDSLLSVIDSLKGTITQINHLYFKLYPSAPKLLYGEFKSDSLSLDLLGIDGNITTLKYGTNFNRYTYQFKDGTLRAQELSNSNSKAFRASDLYLYGGYEAIAKAPVIGSDLSFYRRNWRLKGNTFLTIERQPSLSAQLSLGYKLR